jgi:hypothetical protein
MCEGNFPHTKHVPEICRFIVDFRISGDLGFASTVFSSCNFSCGIINGSIIAFFNVLRNGGFRRINEI